VGKYYDNFNNKSVNGQSLIHVINLLLGKEIVGVEVGIYSATTFCTFLQMCPNIKTLYGIDNYLPSNVETVSDEYVVDEKGADWVRSMAYHHIKYSGNENKAVILEEDSNTAVNRFEDNSLDFVFLDAETTAAGIQRDIESWYPKVRKGGIIAGHDWDVVRESLALYRFTNSYNDSPFSVFDNVWVWVK
jgi:hypothetical protein